MSLTLTFTPAEGGRFSASMDFNPPEDMPEEIQQFYTILGHGLLAYATADTQDVVNRGAVVLHKMMTDQQEAEAANDTLNKAFDVVV